MTTQRTLVRMSRNRRVVAGPARFSLALLAAVFIAGAAPAAAAEALAHAPSSSAAIQGQTVGVFTGEFVNGIPIYRLPSISVSANRTAELAKMEREEQLTRAKQAKARAAARPPA